MLIPIHRIEGLLRCPGAGEERPVLHWERDVLVAAEHAQVDGLRAAYPVVNGQPVLIDWNRSIVRKSQLDATISQPPLVTRRWNALRVLKGAVLGNAVTSRKNLRRFHDLLTSRNNEARPLVLMVGAATAGMGTEILYKSKEIDQIAFDIYPSALTTFIADAHDIPLQDESVDAACVQAVLEHVLDPQRAVREIFRVLKPGGLVYAETPFMQQVHEGAYDFMRFTELGHRWLFRQFSEIERGAIGGPGLSFYWSATYLAWGLVRNRMAARVLSAPFALFALLDAVIPAPRRIDGANGVYFMGTKTETPVSTWEIPQAYRGAQ